MPLFNHPQMIRQECPHPFDLSDEELEARGKSATEHCDLSYRQLMEVLEERVKSDTGLTHWLLLQGVLDEHVKHVVLLFTLAEEAIRRSRP